MNDSEIAKILDDFKNNPKLKELESLIYEFNIFEAMGAVRQELRHSDFLAFLLNPSEKHNLKDLFLKKFLVAVLENSEIVIAKSNDLRLIDLSYARVERERWHIDILITDHVNNLVCVIENKIDTNEHSDQLKRYLDQVSSSFHNLTKIPVYLTPDGTLPVDENSKYIPTSYNQIADLIEDLLNDKTVEINNEVHIMMKHYVTMLRRHIVPNSDVVKLCQQIYRSHKDALDLIIEHIPDDRLELANYCKKLFEDTLEPELILTHYSKNHVKAIANKWKNIPDFNTYRDNDIGWFAIGIANWSSNPLRLTITVAPVNEEYEFVRDILHQHALNRPDIFINCDKEKNDWIHIYNRTIIILNQFDTLSIDELKRIVRDEWQYFVETELPAISHELMTIKFDGNMS